MIKGRYRVGLLALAIAGLAACGGDDDDGAASASTTVQAPSNLMVSELDGGAHVTWKDNSDNESGFMVERKSGSEDWKVIGNVPFDTTVYHDPNLAAGTYMYRVMAMPKSGEHETGKGAYSGEVMVVIDADSTGGAMAGSGAADGGVHEQHH